jgi:hypothetical protein
VKWQEVRKKVASEELNNLCYPISTINMTHKKTMKWKGMQHEREYEDSMCSINGKKRNRCAIFIPNLQLMGPRATPRRRRAE